MHYIAQRDAYLLTGKLLADISTFFNNPSNPSTASKTYGIHLNNSLAFSLPNACSSAKYCLAYRLGMKG